MTGPIWDPLTEDPTGGLDVAAVGTGIVVGSIMAVALRLRSRMATLGGQARMVLVVFGVGHLVIGHLTLRYTAGQLAVAPLWGWAAIVGGCVASVAALTARRRCIIAAGALLVLHAAGKSAMYLAESLSRDNLDSAAAILNGSIIYALVSLSIVLLWRDVLVPWGRGRAG